MGVGRRSNTAPSQPKHVDIPTPSWCDFVPCASSNLAEDAMSDDDTSDEAYIQRHHIHAVEERQRWAGPLLSQTAANGKKRTRGSSSAKPVTPLFPIPTDCFYMARRSLRSMRNRTSAPSDERVDFNARARALASFQRTATSFARIETVINRELAVIKKEAARKSKRDSPQQIRSQGHPSQNTPNTIFDHSVSDRHLSALRPSNSPKSPYSSRIHPLPTKSLSIRNRNHGTFLEVDSSFSPTSSNELPSENTLLSGSIIFERALADAIAISECFSRQTEMLLSFLKIVSRQRHINHSDPQAFSSLEKQFMQVQNLMSNKSDDEIENLTFCEAFRQEIDERKYPQFAKSFALPSGYCLDGTRRPFDVVADEMGNNHNLMARKKETFASTNGISFNAEELKSGGDTGRENGRGPIGVGSFHRVEERKSFDRNLHTPSRGSPLSVARRLNARQKLRENVKRKPPRIQKDHMERKSYRIMPNVESVPSDSSVPSDPPTPPETITFDCDNSDEKQIEPQEASMSLRFHHVVDVDERKEGSAPLTVVDLDNGQ